MGENEERAADAKKEEKAEEEEEGSDSDGAGGEEGGALVIVPPTALCSEHAGQAGRQAVSSAHKPGATAAAGVGTDPSTTPAAT